MRDVGIARTEPTELVLLRYLGEESITVTGPGTRVRYPFGPERQTAYVWRDDLDKLVPSRQVLGAPLFEVVNGK